MSFFDDKQEVIKIELTEFGKYLFSKGRFKPKYYAFFDDDILYDSKYANFSENQNYSEKRILEETPYIKPHTVFVSKNETNNILNEDYINSYEKYNFVNAEANKDYYSGIGNCGLGTIYSPAFNMNLLSGALENYSTLKFNTLHGPNFIFTPQLKLKNANLNLSLLDDKSLQNISDTNLQYIATVGENLNLVSSQENLFLLIDLKELNTEDLKENFEIEVFEEKIKVVNQKEIKVWNQLFFLKQPTNIKNLSKNETLLMDVYENEQNFLPSPTSQNAEWYFDIFTDGEIIVEPNKKIYSDIYDSDVTNEDKPFGEDC